MLSTEQVQAVLVQTTYIDKSFLINEMMLFICCIIITNMLSNKPLSLRSSTRTGYSSNLNMKVTGEGI